MACLWQEGTKDLFCHFSGLIFFELVVCGNKSELNDHSARYFWVELMIPTILLPKMKKLLLLVILLLGLLHSTASQCVPGQYGINGTCEPCPSNTYSTTTDALQCDQCVNCESCNSTNGDCTSCQLGFQPDGSSCDECAFLTFSDGNGFCQNCDVLCVVCFPTNGSCSLCIDSSHLVNGSCLSCPDEQYFDPEMNTCQNCPQSCLTCNNTGEHNCLSCSPNFEPGTLSCTQCPEGTYSNGLQLCQPCQVVNCQICTDRYYCSTCAESYVQINGTCSLCGVGCQSCEYNQGKITCTNCTSGYVFYIKTGGCICNIDNCQQCSKQDTCNQCKNGYLLTQNQSACVQCLPLNCLSCSSTNYCQLCNSNYTIDEGVCVLDCQVSNCAQCYINGSILCTECQQGYSLNQINNTCNPLCNISNCHICSTRTSCQQCQQNYTLINFQTYCYLCDLPHCMSCNQTYCSQCQQDYYPLYGQCYLCGVVNCTMCNNSDEYLMCIQCSPALYYNETIYQCTSCSVQNCISCNAYNQCDNCSGKLSPSTDETQCLLCQLSNCLSCSSELYCQNCSGQYEALGGTCLLCGVAYCSQCAAQNPQICIQCSEGYQLDDESNRCLCLTSGCLTCLGPNNCSTCQLNYTLSNGTCYPNCGHQNCLNCQIINLSCTLCSANYIVIGGKCRLKHNIPYCSQYVQNQYGLCKTCTSQYSLSIDSTACVYCNLPNCLSCTPIASNLCARCSDGFLLQAYQCVRCQVDNCQYCSSNSNQCQACFKGYQLKKSAQFHTTTCQACPVECQSCYLNNGTCSACLPPYNKQPYEFYGICYFCFQPNCLICTNVSRICQSCYDGFILIDGKCQMNCGQGCENCSSHGCYSCISFYYMMPNNTCQQCPDAPKCINCNQDGECLDCNQGYFLINGTCQPCQPNCKYCKDASYCTASSNPFNTFFITDMEVTQPTILQPNCLQSSYLYPMKCLSCVAGFYLTDGQYCAPCNYSSKCQACQSSDPAYCLSCFPGFFMSSNNTCISCTYPCASCSNNNTHYCTSCVQGYVFIPKRNNCVFLDSQLYQFYPIYIDCLQSWALPQDICNMCRTGFALRSGFCVPCPSGCASCKVLDYSQCVQCLPGWMLTDNLTCSQDICSQGCTQCNTFGCTDCVKGMYLDQNFECQLLCATVCATCNNKNVTHCTSCVYGYTLNNGQCQPENCSATGSCLTCPLGSVMKNNNTDTQINQTCVSCFSSSNCARCSLADLSQCTSCNIGYYLTSVNTCNACPSNCSNCINPDMCLTCAKGYIAAQLNQLNRAANSYSLANSQAVIDCVPCFDLCGSCYGDIYSCTSCSGSGELVLYGNTCITGNNFAIKIVLAIEMSNFTNGYYYFINQILTAAGVNSKNIAVTSIVSGSVVVTLVVSSPSPQGTQEFTDAENNLTNLIQSGGTIAQMPITSSALTVQNQQSSNNNNENNGNSNNNGNNSNNNNNGDNGNNGNGNNESSSGSMSTTSIVLISVLIPAGILVAVAVVVIWVRRKKGRQEEYPEVDNRQVEKDSNPPEMDIELPEIKSSVAREVEKELEVPTTQARRSLL